MPAPAWLVERPIAHRGLHDLEAGLVENSAAAACAAMAGGFAIECDVQLTADGEAVVFHDFTLERLTGASGAVAAHDAAALSRLAYREGGDSIQTLGAFLALIGGRVTLICEVKSRFDGDMRLAARVREVLAAYDGPVAVKSFDPAVLVHLRTAGLSVPLGIVAEANYDDPEWADLPAATRRNLAALAHFPETRPDFLSYHVDDLPHAAPLLCRRALGLPVMAWTVRRPDQRTLAARWADQIVFERFVP